MHAFRINLGMHHFALYGLYIFSLCCWFCLKRKAYMFFKIVWSCNRKGFTTSFWCRLKLVMTVFWHVSLLLLGVTWWLFLFSKVLNLVFYFLKSTFFQPFSAGYSLKGDTYVKNLQLSAVGLFKYVWPFSGHQALKG